MARVFQGGPEPKDPRVREAPYLGWVACLPCVACLRLKGLMNREVQVAHLRAAQAKYEKRESGMASKPSDRWTLPLCMPHHTGDRRAAQVCQHEMDEVAFWEEILGINPFDLCLELNEAYDAGALPAVGVAIIARQVGQARSRSTP